MGTRHAGICGGATSSRLPALRGRLGLRQNLRAEHAGIRGGSTSARDVSSCAAVRHQAAKKVASER
jgi:hypothetical protein